MAGKAAIAAGLAWVLAHFVPGDAAEYPYYAPLGALVSMYPTVFGSAKNGLQTLFGLLLGIVLGLGVFVFGHPNAVTVGIAVGIGVLLGGLKILGTGSTWVATAALFVLVVGGGDAGDYSLGYLVQMLVGVVVGVAVNLLVFPALFFGQAEREMLQLKDALADQLEDISTALTEEWPPEREDWALRTKSLSVRADGVRAAVQEADESRRANPRSFLHPHNVDEEYSELRVLERVNFAVQELTEVLTGVVWSKASLTEIPSELFDPLATAVGEVGELLRQWGVAEPSVSPGVGEQLAVAEDALASLTRQTDAARSNEEPHNAGRTSVVASIIVTLSRIIDFLRPTIAVEDES